METRSFDSGHRTPVFFTDHSHQVLSTCAHLLGLSILSVCLSHRTPSLSSWREWADLSWSNLSVILVLLDSWLFVFFTGVLVNGVGLSSSQDTCALAIYACISFYVLSKVLIYGFLVEKVYIVWSNGKEKARFKTPAYRICSVVLLGYVTVLVLMILGQNSWLRSDGMCIIGLKNFASIPTIAYDLFLNVFLTAMFLWPLWRSNSMNPRLRKVAIRTLYGACASLITSAANMAILTALRGQEFGWACLGSCVTDVALNAMALNWVTAGSCTHTTVSPRANRFSLPTTTVGPTTLVQSDYEHGKETDYRGTATFQTTIRDVSSPPPASLRDYTPHQSLPRPDTRTGASKGLFSSLKAALSHAQERSDTATLVAPATEHVKQLSSRSEEVTNPVARTLQATLDSDIVAGRAQPFDEDVFGDDPYRPRPPIAQQQRANVDNPSPNSNPESDGKPHGFVNRFRSLFSKHPQEKTEEGDLELDFARPDNQMGYDTTISPRTSSSHRPPINQYNPANLPDPNQEVYHEFRRPYPPDKHVRVLNSFVTRMPTIESMGSGEAGSNANSSMYTSSRGHDEDSSLHSTHMGSDSLTQSTGLSFTRGSIGRVSEVEEEGETEGVRWVDCQPEDHGWDGASHSSGMTTYSTATSSGSPCHSFNVIVGHSGPTTDGSSS